MALTFSTKDVADQAIVSETRDGKEYWSAEVEAAVFGTMFVGINPITAANYEKFYQRYVALNMVNGGTDGGVLTLDVCRRLVGLGTNASALTDVQFGKKLARQVMERAGRQVEREKEAAPGNQETDGREPGPVQDA